ncbi:MAG: 3'-5' exonuclease, partial [Candidatus Thalassarchaeaceae archaeon]|nr:3'-5' exonuclease [Candidatus Thalassarchaeaceae archaeon]
SDRIVQMLEETLDHSDLLIAYPDDSDRQNAERAVTVIKETLDREEGSLLAVADALRSLREDNRGGVRSITKPPSDTVRLMSIHKSKGLEAKVVILADLFSERQVGNKHQSQMRFGVSSDIFSGNPKPWGGNRTLRSGVWNYSSLINRSRRDAENRRLLYVAATRARDSLIIVGAPDGNKSSEWINGQGVSFTHDSRKYPPLGHMITNSKRHLDWVNRNHDSQWLTSDDKESTEVPFERGTIVFDPISLHEDHDGTKGRKGTTFALLHSHECMSQSKNNTTPYIRMKKALDAISLSPDREKLDFCPVESPPRYIRIAPSSLHFPTDDSDPDILEQRKRKRNFNETLTPTELGTIVHRVVEVGIGNCGTDPTPPLPHSWTTRRPNRLNDRTLLNTVLKETGVGPTNESMIEAISELMKNIEDGYLGRITKGETVKGHTLQGLRTELPFLLSKEVEFEPLIHSLWTPDGKWATTLESRAVVQMEGFIDIVICTQDPEGRPTMRAVDIKTDSTMRTLLAEHNSDPHNPSLDFENRMLLRHGIQLAIYHNALVAMNEQLPIKARRLLLPPAIVWAGNGRMVEYPIEVLENLNSMLESILVETAREHLAPSS